MKKILINAMMVKKDNTGLGIYACEVLNLFLPELKMKCDITILCSDLNSLQSKVCIAGVKCIEIRAKSLVKREFAVGKYVYSHQKDFDLFYSLSHHGFPLLKINEIITVHDIIPRLYPEKRYHQYIYYIFYLPLVIHSSKKVITDSYSTKRDLERYYHCKRVDVAYCGTSQPMSETSRVTWNGKRKKRYITIGIHYPYKNLHTVIDLFLQDIRFADRELVIIGKSDNAYGKQLEDMVVQGNAEGRIKFTGYISYNEKQKYIQDSYALIYPSKYEGFGLPVLEGMAQGVPVACSNTSSLPEVAGDAAAMFDPEDMGDIADKILSLDDAQYAQVLIAKGYDNLKRFSWIKCVNTIMDVICDAVEESRHCSCKL